MYELSIMDSFNQTYIYSVPQRNLPLSILKTPIPVT